SHLSRIFLYTFLSLFFFFFFNASSPTVIYTLSLHDALPIFLFYHLLTFYLSCICTFKNLISVVGFKTVTTMLCFSLFFWNIFELDRKSTRLNSSHVKISYAVFCLKKKTIIKTKIHEINNVAH